MILAFFTLIVIVVLAVLFTKNIKLFFGAAMLSVLLITAGVCILKPVQHKQFAIQIIDYLIKFNTDGSITTTKQTTTTQLQKDGR